MTTRREFLQTSASALAGIAFVGCDLLAAAPARAQARRRDVVVTAADLILGTPGASDADKEAMLGGTAMTLLGIEA